MVFPSSVFNANAIPQNLHTMWKETWLIRSSTPTKWPRAEILYPGPRDLPSYCSCRTSCTFFRYSSSLQQQYCSSLIRYQHHPLEEREAKPESITLFMPQKIGLTFATVCIYISSTMTLRAFSSYQQYCGPSAHVWLFCRSFGAPRRWRRQTHPSGFSVWARSIRRRLPLPLCPPGRGRPLPGQVALGAVPDRWGPWHLAAGHTGCPPAAQVWADNAVGSPGPIFHQCSGRKRGWRRWSTTGARQSACSRSDATYRIHPEVERKRKVNALPRQEAYHYI